MAYGPGVNEINYTDLPPTGDTIASAAQKTQNQFNALYTGLNADIVRASAAEVNTAEDTTKIVTPGTLLKGKASGVASLNESGKVTETELPNASDTVKGVVKVGSNISVDEGVVSVPEATDTVKGVVKVGSNISVDEGVVSVPEATDAVKGVIELATPDEVKQGTDTERAVTPAGFKAAFGEFYPIGAEPTYVDANNFTAAGDLTAIFTKGRVLKITDTGGTFNAVCSASAYDAGTELTTVTVAGDTIDSGISAVLYAVQQHTGAIWESGSNANGSYVKFADGTMVCTQQISLANNGLSFEKNTSSSNWWAIKTFTFPAEFSENPKGLSASVKNEATGLGWASVRTVTTTTAGITIYDDLDRSGQAITCSYTAIGRWY